MNRYMFGEILSDLHAVDAQTQSDRTMFTNNKEALLPEEKVTVNDLVAQAEKKRDAAIQAGNTEAAESAQQALNEAGKLAGS
jgi:hypothetical protein